MKLLYYPGCTLRSKAVAFDASARQTAAALGIELVELENFTCCGALFPQISENLMPLLAPARILVQAQRADGNGRLVTLCSFCYNTLKRANKLLQHDSQKRDTLSEYLEDKYNAAVKVVHLLEVLRDDIGYQTIKQKVSNPLTGLKVGAYYGCMLLRPEKDLGLDNPEEPTVMEELLQALGCEVVDFPAKTDCCGSFLVVSNAAVAADCSRRILETAERLRLDALVTSCPLCHFNLTRPLGGESGHRPAVVYFTELLARALGLQTGNPGLPGERLKTIQAGGDRL